MDAREILSLIRAWLVVILVTVGLSAGAAFIVSARATPTYEASATVLVGPPLSSARIDYTDLLIAQNLAQTYSQVAVTRPVLDAAAAAVGIPQSDNDLPDRVTARTPPASTFVIITAQASTATEVAAIANAVAAELVKQAPSVDALAGVQAAYVQSLADNASAIAAAETELATLNAIPNPTPAQTQRISQLQTQLASLRAERATLLDSAPPPQANVLSIVEPAAPPKTAIGPRTATNVALGAVIGLVVALAIIVVVENSRADPAGRRRGAGRPRPGHAGSGHPDELRLGSHGARADPR